MNERLSTVGGILTVRPVEATDVAGLDRMFGRLSRTSLHRRFLSPLHEVPTSALVHMAAVDHDRSEGLVALDGADIVAIANYEVASRPAAGPREAEVAVVVDDAWQRRGVGQQLVRDLAALALQHGCRTLVARALPDNQGVRALIRTLAPGAVARIVDGLYEIHITLDDPPRARRANGRPERRNHVATTCRA